MDIERHVVRTTERVDIVTHAGSAHDLLQHATSAWRHHVLSYSPTVGNAEIKRSRSGETVRCSAAVPGLNLHVNARTHEAEGGLSRIELLATREELKAGGVFTRVADKLRSPMGLMFGGVLLLGGLAGLTLLALRGGWLILSTLPIIVVLGVIRSWHKRVDDEVLIGQRYQCLLRWDAFFQDLRAAVAAASTSSGGELHGMSDPCWPTSAVPREQDTGCEVSLPADE